ncbi:MAG: hypothetical protein N2C12_13400 [Planctomycetales bacterium]
MRRPEAWNPPPFGCLRPLGSDPKGAHGRSPAAPFGIARVARVRCRKSQLLNHRQPTSRFAKEGGPCDVRHATEVVFPSFLSAWYAYLKRDWLSFTFRAEGVWEENYRGADPALVPAEPLISTARPDIRGGEWINFGYGFQALMHNSHLINCEITHPVYQNLVGIQLKSTWNLFVSWSKGW